MKIKVTHATLNQVLFATFFNLLFFLPYLGNTHFRVDQLVGVFATLWLGFRATINPLPIGHELVVLFKWSLTIVIWAFVLAMVTPGRIIDGMQLVNSFSYLVGGVSLFVLVRSQLKKELRVFLLVSLLFSILINALAVYMWMGYDNAFIQSLLANYGGVPDPSYGGMGTIGAVSYFAGRIPSLFPHTQAFAVYDLLVLTISSYVIYLCEGWWGRGVCAAAMLMSFVGGVLSSSKTYTLCVIAGMLIYFLISLPSLVRRPRINVYYLAVSLFAVGITSYFYFQNRFLRDQLAVITTLDVSGTLGTRIGEHGYLVKSGTVAAMLEPVHFLFGMGGGVSSYAWSDNGYFQVIMYGGIGFFFFFYGYLIYLCSLIAQRRDEMSARLFLILYGALFFGNVGTLLFLFPRTGLLLAFFTLVALEHKDLVTPVIRGGHYV